MTETYRLSIVRLANAEHAELASLSASLSSNQSVAVCGGAGAAQGDTAANVTGSACVPGVPMWLNVTHDVDWVRHIPKLLMKAGRLQTDLLCTCRHLRVLQEPIVVLQCLSDIERYLVQVSLRPGLRWPGVTGIRVEVNGQVLSQGGDVAADQLEDTTAETINRRVCTTFQLWSSSCCALSNLSGRDLITC